MATLWPQADWVVAGSNSHEDLHFSSLYLRRSQQSRALEGYGYEWIVARYEKFNETYYLSAAECTRVATNLIARMTWDDLTWFDFVLAETRARSRRLMLCWPIEVSRRWLAAQSNETLLDLYGSHLRLHDNLYEVARVPEILDRGTRTFTKYLYSTLEDGLGYSHHDAAHIFQALTQSASGGLLARDRDFVERTAMRLNGGGQADGLWERHPELALLLLPAWVRRDIRDYVDRWRHLPYHGFSRRQGLSEWSVCVEVAQAAIGLRAPSAIASTRAAAVSNLEDLAVDLPSATRRLFSTFVEIGVVKLERRSWQLMNFRALDALMGELALRLDVSEWGLRCLLPEEILGLFRGDVGWSPDIDGRAEGMTYVLGPDLEEVLPLEASDGIIVDTPQPEALLARDSQFTGFPVFPGQASGRAWWIDRYDPEWLQRFAIGDILVSGTTDPDLIPLIRIAGAVVTEEGGVASHAAILCRELEVPCVVGCEGIVARGPGPETVSVDAFQGIVIVRSNESPA